MALNLHIAEPDRVRLRTELVREDEAQRATLRLQGALELSTAALLWDALQGLRGESAAKHIEFDLSQVSKVDGAGAALLVRARDELRERGLSAELRHASGQVERLVALYAGAPEVLALRPVPSVFEQIGTGTLAMLREIKLGLGFLGELILELKAVSRSLRSANFRDVPAIMERTGADALPIVLLINFLVGLVMAFQASVQLKRFGANILVADLIGISMTRELGPLMTAIVVCGRSGAAFAAELGTMVVNEEIDALRVLRLSPMRYLVLPRVLGMFLVLPLLACFADLMGVVGGLVVGVTRLDLSASAYIRQTFRAVTLWDAYSGLIKACVFAVALGLVACEQGLATRGGAEGVGKRTTTAVVTGLFTLILLDAVFTVAFRLTGL